jgi:hypothetical protein
VSAERSFGFTAAVITGYPRARLLPVLMPSLRIEAAPGVALRIGALPRFKAGRANVLHLALEFDMH